MGSIEFEGKRVAIEAGDSVASALYRSGVRTFTRSLKYHRRRGLYCLTGDCPNCLVNIDGEPGCRACTTEASDGQKVSRESGFPSTERDLLSVMDKLHALMPVGFYYKTFIRPRLAWQIAEKAIRRTTGVGRLPAAAAPVWMESRYLHCDVLVVGGGVAGLAAALTAARGGHTVIVCDEGALGEKIPPGPARDRIRALAAEVVAFETVTVLERHTAVGIYEGSLVPLVGPSVLVRVDPDRVVVATGAVETHAVFPGNDLPGVWLGRGAARMAGAHGVLPGSRAVVAAGTVEGVSHISTLQSAGVSVVAAVVPDDLAAVVPAGVETILDGKVVAALGKKQLVAVAVGTREGTRGIHCDALVLSIGFAPRDSLLRMAGDLPVTGAGDVILPGCSLDEAETSGAAAGRGGGAEHHSEPESIPLGDAGFVCICEDVAVGDLDKAWDEGWRSSEILKRYTTATMGPCQGAMCGRHLADFVASRSSSALAGSRTTSRPPARSMRLEDLAAGVSEIAEKRTALHEVHLQANARLDWSGSWMRPYRYGDVAEEYTAVRQRVSLMDVSTLGKFLVAGRDAAALADGVFPCRIRDLGSGRSRYVLALDEAGYVFDDGLICSIGDGRYYLTSTSGGADHMESWLRNWADRWDLHVHLVNQTAMLGAINVAGPRSRDLLSRVCVDAIDAAAIPYPGHAAVTVAGVACRAIRVGFVGELSFELHHPRSRSVDLWSALMSAGADLGIVPHGLDALDVLRLEKGHLYMGQDTLPDDHPSKLGLEWAVAMDKGSFVGRTALERMAGFPPERKLIGLALDERSQRGTPLYAGAAIVGRVTSSARSQVLGRNIGLGWVRAVDGEFPEALRAGRVSATVVPTPFYDPAGERLRA